MKKTVKFTALICVLCMIITVFSGCSLKSNKVYENKDGSLTYLGKRYIELKKSDDVYFKYDYMGDSSYIIKEDESWLYSNLFGESTYCDISRDRIFIEDINSKVYCREDKYRSVAERTENGFEAKKYLYLYDEYSGFMELSWQEKEYYLTDSDLAMVNRILREVTPIENGSHMSENSDCWIEVYGCSDDLLLSKLAFTILRINGEYYIETKDQYFNPFVYEVPSVYDEEFDKMIEKYIESYF